MQKLLGLVFLILVFSCQNPPSEESARQESAWGPDDKTYVFWDNWEGQFEESGNVEVYSLNIETGDVTNLTNNPGVDANAVFSPDKSKLALFYYPEEYGGIFLMDPDGNNKQSLTPTRGPDYNPTWSPDGQQIAFQSVRDGNLQIYVMNHDGSNQHNISNNDFEDSNPGWSPDGKRIAFVVKINGIPEIFLMNIDGSGRRQITDHKRGFRNPKWSPDGRKLVFHSDEIDPETGDDFGSIFLYDLETTEITELTDPNDGDYDFNPFFNDAGTRIGFNSYINKKMEIRAIEVATGEETVLYKQP